MSHFACQSRITFKFCGKVETKFFTRMVTLPHSCIHAKWIASEETARLEVTFLNNLSFLVADGFESVIRAKGSFN